MTGRDGRSFDLADPGAIVLAFQSAGIDLPIDYDHANDRPEFKTGGPVPAAGWIKELKADDTGLWGRVEWTATAAELISNREYRFLSPSFLYAEKTGAIARLKGAGLVHHPNLHLTALNSQENTMPAPQVDAPQTNTPTIATLAGFLGLPSTATPMHVLRAVLDLFKATPAAADLSATMAELVPGVAPDPAKFLPVETVRAMLSERNLTLATMSEARATEKVSEAMRSGFLSPAMKPWALALCRSDEASFDTFLQTTIPPFAHLLKSSTDHLRAPPVAGRGPILGTEAQEALCAQLGLAPGTLRQ